MGKVRAQLSIKTERRSLKGLDQQILGKLSPYQLNLELTEISQ